MSKTKTKNCDFLGHANIYLKKKKGEVHGFDAFKFFLRLGAAKRGKTKKRGEIQHSSWQQVIVTEAFCFVLIGGGGGSSGDRLHKEPVEAKS